MDTIHHKTICLFNKKLETANRFCDENLMKITSAVRYVTNEQRIIQVTFYIHGELFLTGNSSPQMNSVINAINYAIKLIVRSKLEFQLKQWHCSLRKLGELFKMNPFDGPKTRFVLLICKGELSV
jgi:hypothetical protein